MAMDASEVPTIRQILDDASVQDYLEPEVYANLVAALEYRESVMLNDAEENMIRKFERKLDRIIDMV